MATKSGLGPLSQDTTISMGGVKYKLKAGEVAELTITEAKPDKIEVDRLKVDREYWDSVARKGAEAFGVRPSGKLCWYKDISLTGYKYSHEEQEGFWGTNEGDPKHGPLFPRPPAKEVDWSGDGLPPVGCVCESLPFFHKCRVVAEYMDGIVVHDLHDDEFFRAFGWSARFRPVKTQEQKEREELSGVIEGALANSGWEPDPADAQDIASAVIKAGYRRQYRCQYIKRNSIITAQSARST